MEVDRYWETHPGLQLLDLLLPALQGQLLSLIQTVLQVLTVCSMFFFIRSRWALVSCSFFSSSAIMAA